MSECFELKRVERAVASETVNQRVKELVSEVLLYCRREGLSALQKSLADFAELASEEKEDKLRKLRQLVVSLSSEGSDIQTLSAILRSDVPSLSGPIFQRPGFSVFSIRFRDQDSLKDWISSICQLAEHPSVSSVEFGETDIKPIGGGTVPNTGDGAK